MQSDYAACQKKLDVLESYLRNQGVDLDTLYKICISPSPPSDKQVVVPSTDRSPAISEEVETAPSIREMIEGTVSTGKHFMIKTEGTQDEQIIKQFIPEIMLHAHFFLL